MPRKNVLLFLLVLSISFILMTYQSKKGHLFTTNFFSDITEFLTCLHKISD